MARAVLNAGSVSNQNLAQRISSEPEPRARPAISEVIAILQNRRAECITLQMLEQNVIRVNGEAVLIDANQCFIQSANRVVAAVGVEDLLIVDTWLKKHRDAVREVPVPTDDPQSAAQALRAAMAEPAAAAA